MKTKVIFSLMFVGLLVSTQAYCQIQPHQPNEPKEDIKVNREFDENGNMIRYDSTYTWSWSSTGENGAIPDSMFQFNNGFGNFSIFGMDSLFQQFNTMMPGSMFPDSMFFNEPFFQGSDPFSQFGPDIQSLFNGHFQQFFNQPGNNQNYDDWMYQFKQQMDSIRQNQPQVVPQAPAPKPEPKKVKYNQPVKNI